MEFQVSDYASTQPSELSNDQYKSLGQTQLCFTLRRHDGLLSIRSVRCHVRGRNAMEWKLLRREPGLLHILLTVHVNEGPQRRLEKVEIRFAGNYAAPLFSTPILFGS
jgi:hypothetical protein